MDSSRSINDRPRQLFDCEKCDLKLYKCKNCEINFDNLIHLRKHIKQHFLQETETSCSPNYVKNGCLQSKIKVDSSTVFKTSSKLYECDKCTYKAKRMCTLKRHFRSKHISDQDKNWWKCEQCTFKTTHKTNLKKHFVAKHTKDDDKRWFKCDRCDYKSLFKTALKDHFIFKHSNDEDKRWFRCEICTYKSIKKWSVKKHFLAKHFNSGNDVLSLGQIVRRGNVDHCNNLSRLFDCEKCSLELYCCKNCDMTFNTVVDVRKHKEDCLEEAKENNSPNYILCSYTCTNCCFKTNSSLQWFKHVKDECLKQDQNPPEFYECDKCPYQAKKMTTLKSHLPQIISAING